ncbi:MAG: TonB family protein, partial [candidate division WOR-3 bacterium]
PLLSTTAEVDIAGVIADVKVVQLYKNEGKKPVEAIYVFPASTRAAVYGMKMTIGDRTIVADIQKREEARQNYEAARDAGQSASLLEQQRPNVFQMNVANIMPGDTIKVELYYTELLVPTEGVYEFVYPTVVGPRYSNVPDKGAPDTERWVENPYTRQGEAPLYEFDIKLNLSAGLPIQDMSCPTHKTSISYDGLTWANVKLDPSEQDGGNRDFILKYRLAGGEIQSGLLLFEGEEENFFLAMIQPPKRVRAKDVPGREYVFIVDVSGSMHGFPIDISKTLLRDLITSLKPTDKFNVLLFAGGNSVMSERSVDATKANISKAVKVIDEQQGGGGTELLPALKRALALPRADGMSRTVVIVTDGYVTVEAEAFDLIRSSLGDANMFAFGIGSGVNRHLIEGMAHVGMGEPFVVTEPERAATQADRFREYIQSPVLTRVKADFRGLQVYDVEPPTIPDVLAERPVIVFGKYKGKPTGSITVTGRSGRGKYSKTLKVAEFDEDPTNSALRYLWARHRIQILDDYNNLAHDDKRVEEVTRLGLEYNLLTQYTSFVAIDSKVRNTDGEQVTVKQPLPLPQGVSDYAVGGYAASGASRGWSGVMAKKSMLAPAPPVSPQSVYEACGDEEGDTYRSDADIVTRRFADAEVKLGEVRVSSVLSKSTVERAINRVLQEVLDDYLVELDADSGLEGEIQVRLTVKPDGSVGKVEVLKSELNPALDKEVARVLESLSFPNMTTGEITIQATLNFSH